MATEFSDNNCDPDEPGSQVSDPPRNSTYHKRFFFFFCLIYFSGFNLRIDSHDAVHLGHSLVVPTRVGFYSNSKSDLRFASNGVDQQLSDKPQSSSRHDDSSHPLVPDSNPTTN